MMRDNRFLWQGFLSMKPGWLLAIMSLASSSVLIKFRINLTVILQDYQQNKQPVISQISFFTGIPSKLESCTESSKALELAKYATETRMKKIFVLSHFQGLTVEATTSSVPEGNETNTQESALHLTDKVLSSSIFNLQCSMADAVKSSLVCTSHTWWYCFSQHCLAALTNYSGVFLWFL